MRYSKWFSTLLSMQNEKSIFPKRQLCQFFTANSDYILSGFERFVKNKSVVDCFAGAGDLLKWAKKNGANSIRGFDVDKNYVDNKIVFKKDSLKNPQKYDFVITNPPYLYQNKMKDNSILANSKHTDLYQLSLEKIMDSREGIVIVPINFLSAENSRYIRKIFLEKFEIIKANYFTQQVFPDTTYNVISFYYKQKKQKKSTMKIDWTIFPENKRTEITIHHSHNWQIGGEFLSKINESRNLLKISRLEEKDLQNGNIKIKAAYNHLDDRKEFFVNKNFYEKIKNNIIILKAIDTGTNDGKICLDDIRKYGCDALISIKTSRNQIQIMFPCAITIPEQEKIIKLFNDELEQKRSEYYSLFMTNYRDKDRKRISFNFAYNFINYLYFDKLGGGSADKKFKRISY